jgi:ABC-type branched-subunit amino acid transport system substrate-binding protein
MRDIIAYMTLSLKSQEMRQKLSPDRRDLRGATVAKGPALARRLPEPAPPGRWACRSSLKGPSNKGWFGGHVREHHSSRRFGRRSRGSNNSGDRFLPAAAQETIKVGILHSLSGTMAISETTLKDVMLMLIEEQNKKGGVLGKKLEAVVVDPASNWPLFAEKARELIAKDKVSAVFGCWTSVSRKSVLPVFKELNSMLFYPVQYEGEESERNVFYTGAAPNQQAIPAVDYLAKEEKVQRWVLAGTDYVYPRTTNKILEAYLKSKGVRPRTS